MADITPGWGGQWDTLSTAINDYYGGGVAGAQYQQVVQMLNSGNYTMEEMESILGSIPEFTRTYNSSGQLTGVSYNVSTSASSAAGSVAQQVNSNAAGATQTQFSSVQTITKNPETGKVAISDNVVKYKTGQLAPTTMKSVGTSALAALCATGVGISLGKTIDSTLYNLNPEFWNDNGLGALNPETWNSITVGDDSVNGKLFNMIFGVDSTTGNPQAYISEDTFAYMAAYMASNGVFSINEESSTIDVSNLYNENFIPLPIYQASSPLIIEALTEDDFGNRFKYTINLPSGVKAFGYSDYSLSNPDSILHILCASETSQVLTYDRYNYKTGLTNTSQIYITSRATTKSGNTYYTGGVAFGYLKNDAYNFVIEEASWSNGHFSDDACSILFEGTTITVDGIPGITSQTGATQFDVSGISDYTDISEVLTALKNQYPELWENRAEVSPDGDNTIVYVPIGFPTGGVGTRPTTNGATQSNTAPDISGDGDNATDELIKTLIDAITHPKTGASMESDTNTPTKPINPNGDPRGTGENPAIVTPTGSASALWKIYNPSQTQLDTFGAWLWSSDFVDQLLKVFNDPMQAIIGLHKIYCTPPTSGSGAIKVGYLVSDASANYVSNQYTEVDCGSVNLNEHFNNAFDYDGFTKVTVFLPFIGFRDLEVKDVMRGKIGIKYGVDVLTGACLAKITVTRDLYSPIMYTFSGNCSVQYPVSSGSYVGIVTGLLGLVGGIAGSIATGGALAPALVGAAAGIPRMHTSVEHSGTISANAGAMGPKKPYLVIQRPQTHMPIDGTSIEGMPQNENVVIGSLTGFMKVKKVNLEGIPATGSELDEIRNLLESGVYI